MEEKKGEKSWVDSLPEWKRTDKWAPASPGGGSAGFSVENPKTGELGHAKPKRQAEEILGFRLAVEAGVNVPHVELGRVGDQVVAVSKLWGAQSMDVPMLRRRLNGDNDDVRSALRTASGLLVYHSWIGTTDLKDAHLVVRPGPAEGTYEVGHIDFALGAFGWKEGAWGQVQVAPGPPALVASRDVEVIESAMARIESIADDQIRAVVSELSEEVLPSTDQARIVKGLIHRRGKLRSTHQAAGWLPAEKRGESADET